MGAQHYTYQFLRCPADQIGRLLCLHVARPSDLTRTSAFTVAASDKAVERLNRTGNRAFSYNKRDKGRTSFPRLTGIMAYEEDP